MQQTVQSETIHIQRVRGKLTSQLSEFLFDLLWYAHIKHALHQGLNGEQMSIDVLQISDGLLNGVTRFLRAWSSSEGGLTCLFNGLTAALMLLKIFQHST